jgi:PEP-CTERM/exosortase A-associated glycosyltransferase
MAATASTARHPGSGATRVLHVLDHSLPEQSGYASRSHAILTALTEMGLHVDAITSPKHGACEAASETIDAVRYLRTGTGEGTNSGAAGQVRTVLATRHRARRYLATHGADLVHAHSPCLNGLAAMALGRPLLYEMRSSWEDAAVSSGTTTEGSMRYRLSKALETYVMRRAQAITVICDGLKQELIGRGIPESKITLVPNALPASMFEPGDPARSSALRHRFGLHDKRVIGFFGSFFEWEGVELLIKAMPKILKVVPDARVLLAGGGRQENHLQSLVSTLGLSSSVVFAGRVEAGTIRDLYGSADVMVYPRTSDRLTEMVTPLKPLEAMAQRIPVIASDVGGHFELIRDGQTGFLFPAADIGALAAKVVEVLGAGSTVSEVTEAARQFVERERRWSVVCDNYVKVYERLLRRPLIRMAEARAG